ncbi:MAG: hypothetical protein H0V17_36655, partial [Deltaproteobacteria bacterium]|nr:hypothetical protein [Deltaproteobacteria bacterium]
MIRSLFITCWCVAAVASHAAADDSDDEALRADEVKPDQFDPLTCRQKKRQVTASVDAIPVTLVDFNLSGALTDPEPTLRTLLAPTMQRHRVLSEDLREEATAAAAAIGYQLVGLGTKDTPNGKHAQVHLSPMPIVRKVNVKIRQSIRDTLTTPLFEEEVQRRM